VTFPPHFDVSKLNIPLSGEFALSNVSRSDLNVEAGVISSCTGFGTGLVESLACVRSNISLTSQPTPGVAPELDSVRGIVHDLLTKSYDPQPSKSSLSSGSPTGMNWSSPALSTLKQKASETAYHLTAVVRHLGSTAASGHFICDAKRDGVSNGEWDRFNDSVVSSISEV
jgi:hypothetical protein